MHWRNIISSKYTSSIKHVNEKMSLITPNLFLFAGFLNPHSDPYSRSIANHGLMDQIAGKREKLFFLGMYARR